MLKVSGNFHPPTLLPRVCPAWRPRSRTPILHALRSPLSLALSLPSAVAMCVCSTVSTGASPLPCLSKKPRREKEK
eukprot:2169100-Prymnesium_polylepis.1